MVHGHGSRAGSRVALVVVLALSATLLLDVGYARSATTLCTPDPSWPSVDGGATAELSSLLNQHRSVLGLPALKVSPTLSDAASWKAQHMAHFGYLSHDDPAPPRARTFSQRALECGYPHQAAENIAYYPSAALAFQQWLLSPSHRGNIEDPNMRASGVAAAQTAGGSYYWVMIFGAVADAGSTDPVSTDPSSTQTPTPDASATEDPSPEPTSTDGSGTPAPDETTPVASPAPDDGTDVVNHAPDAARDLVRVRRGRWVKIFVLKNDSDIDGDTLRIKKIARRPSKGRAVIADSRAFIRYKARAGATGRDRFSYVVSDGRGGTARATVRIRIRR